MYTKTLFQAMFPSAIGNSFREFLFGKPCARCDAGSFAKRWARYDGTGSWRMHNVWIGPDHDFINDYESKYCERNGWFSRHYLTTAFFCIVILISIVTGIGSAFAHDHARPDLDNWFNHLTSGKGLCCSNNDGTALSDVDWESKDGHYRVRLDNEWIDVPEDAVITEPNLAGRTMVWPIKYNGGTSIRCFLAGSMT